MAKKPYYEPELKQKIIRLHLDEGRTQKSGFNDGTHSRHYLELGIGLESSVIYHLFRFSNMLIELL